MKTKKQNTSLPFWARTLLRFLVTEDDFDQYCGDLEEAYSRKISSSADKKARRFLINQIFYSIPKIFLSNFYWGTIMFKNNLKILLRSMIREKGYSITNITGLTIGMICSFMIIAYVFHELSYDKFYKNADRIYRLDTHMNMGQADVRLAVSNVATGLFLKNNLEEVEDVVHLRRMGSNVSVKYEDKEFYEKNIFYSGNSIFNIFSLPLILGNESTALTLPDNVIISESVAHKYFGSENPVGKTLKFDNSSEYKVTGVFQDLPSNTHLCFDILCSFETLTDKIPAVKTRWIGEDVDFDYYTYLLLKDGANSSEIEKKIPAYVDQFMGEVLRYVGGEFKFFLYPMKDIYLHSTAANQMASTRSITYIYLFAGIAILIIIIASMNFINLSTAKYVKRTREVGLRKVFGSTRKSIIKQFLSESVIYCLISFVLSILAVLVILPWYTSIVNINMQFTLSLFLQFVLYSFLIALIVGLLAGFYPAFFLSSFAPVETIKGNMASASKVNGRLRYALVVFQFTISIALIIGTMIIHQQANYMKNKKLGFKKDHVLVLQIMDESIKNSTEEVKSEFLQNPNIEKAAFSSCVPGTGAGFNVFVYADEDYSQSKMFGKWSVDPDYLDLMGMELVSGRNFSKDITTDLTESIIINQSSLKEYNLSKPLGNILREIDGFQKPVNIIGIVKDFHFVSVHDRIRPMTISQKPDYYKFLSLRIKSNNLENTMAYIEDVWTHRNHTETFDYYFLDDAFDDLYKTENELSSLLLQFTILAIFIACLGMAGLAAFTSEQRTKEIGVRKVLGASLSDLVSILIKQFVKWVLLANLFAWPISYFIMEKWLQNYPYRIELTIEIFIVSAIIALVISVITVGYQTLKAALANPVKALKYE